MQNSYLVKKYLPLVFITDILVVTFVGLISYFIRFGSTENDFIITFIQNRVQVNQSYISGLILLSTISILSLPLFGAYSERNLAGGSSEYSSVTQSIFFSGALILLLIYLTNASFSRVIFVVFYILLFIGLIMGRWLCRQLLRTFRRKGTWSTATIVIGNCESIENLVDELNKRKDAGYLVTGALVTDSSRNFKQQDGLHVLPFNSRNIDDFLSREKHCAFIIAGNNSLTEEQIQELSWKLEEDQNSLIVLPTMLDVSGPRIHARQVAGLPFVFIEAPRFKPFQLVFKRVIDLFISMTALLIFAPIFVTCAIFIKIEDNGPVFYKQIRVGLNSKTFWIYKFRSMRVNADEEKNSFPLDEVLDQNSPLFKIKEDPRVTSIGKILRRWSLDELPQLVNVVLGQMSIVGPRPPLPEEVEKYEAKVHRKFLVKPGITGLWQISGRSNLSWEESVKFDLYYVENWTVLEDLVIMARTAKAVISGNGAY